MPAPVLSFFVVLHAGAIFEVDFSLSPHSRIYLNLSNSFCIIYQTYNLSFSSM